MSMPPDPFVQSIVRRLTPLGEVRAKRMFGGHGLWAEGWFIAIVADGKLLLKVDDGNRGDFEAFGIGPFQPYADRPDRTMQFYETPAPILESWELVEWAEKAMKVARRAAARRSGARGRGGLSRSPAPVRPRGR